MQTLKDFLLMLAINKEILSHAHDRLIFYKLNHDRALLAFEHQRLVCSLKSDWKNVYNYILYAIERNIVGLFFVYRFGGTRKSFIWRTFSTTTRSKGEMVLNVASNGITSLLLPGGRIAHLLFTIPLVIDENLTCNIK